MRAQSFFPGRQLGLTFGEMSDVWNKYAPTVSSDLKTVRTQVEPLVAPAPGQITTPPTTIPKPVTSPTNLLPAPAYQASNTPTILAVVIGLGVLGGGGYYLWKSGVFKKKR